MDNTKRERVLELLNTIFIEPVRAMASEGYTFIYDPNHISFNNFFESYEITSFFKYNLGERPIEGLNNDLSPEENIEKFKGIVIEAISELKRIGITDIIVEDGDKDDNYEGKECLTLIKLKGSELLAGFRYYYYSYGETEYDEKVTYLEPYEVVVTKYRVVK